MSFIPRGFRLLGVVAIVTVVVNPDARMMAGAIFHDAYAVVAGQAAPKPLDRPPLLAQADLGDCLRGGNPTDSNDIYASFCADLAGLAGPVAAVAEAGLAALPMPSPATPRENGSMTAMTPHETRCLIDEAGAAMTPVGSGWTKNEPRYAGEPELNRHDGRLSRIVFVPQSCDVQSPLDAKVLYAGPFKGYLGVVILGTDTAKRLIVAGLGEVSVKRGDSVTRGAIIGATATTTAPALANVVTTNEAALLYIADSTTPPAS